MKFEFFKSLWDVPILIIIWIISFIMCQQINAVTLVYNMRIRRTFVLGLANIVGKEKKPIWVLSSVPIVYKRDRHIIEEPRGVPQTEVNVCEKRLVLGSIFNLRYIPTRNWWFEITTGLQNESLRSKGIFEAHPLILKASRTGWDDIVLAGGYNMFLGKNSQVVIYGIAGFPTKRKVTLNEIHDPLVGTRLFSIGAGSEFSYGFINTSKKSFVLVFQNRVLHFFDRNFEPILPPDAKLQPGNVFDLLFSMRYRYKNNIFETGYNPTFFTNQAIIFETEIERRKNFVRHSFYGSYAHFIKEFPIFKKPAIVGSGLNISRSKRFDTKIISAWLNFTLIF